MFHRALIISIVLLTTLSACKRAGDDFMRDWTFTTSEENPVRFVDLPHDAMLEAVRTPDVPTGPSRAWFPGGKYIYEKSIKADKGMLGKHVTLRFEGVYRNAEVFLNGRKVGENSYGYTAFDVCLDSCLRKGKNLLRVVADNSSGEDSRWYSGGGIYRPVHLLIQDADAYLEDVVVETIQASSPARIRVKTNHRGGDRLRVSILSGKQELVSCDGDDVELTIPEARLWSAEDPFLYCALVELFKDGKIVERRCVEFGIRSLAWNASEGLLVNGKPVLLKGACIHHDNGVIGACEYEDAALRRIALLKRYGFNAVRSAHNPASEAVLKACDRLGMYVMDELWDMWYEAKNPHDYSVDFPSNWKSDVEAMVRKDRSHPSVIMYSIGNELIEPASSEGLSLEREVVEYVHGLDATRAVTAGMNMSIMMSAIPGEELLSSLPDNLGALMGEGSSMSSDEFNALFAQEGMKMLFAIMSPAVDNLCTPALDALDIAGYNYGQMRYALDAVLHPERIIVGSETMPYTLPSNWAAVKATPSLIGDFMWTGWDYLGEVGIGGWFYSSEGEAAAKRYPWLLADTGALDILGNPNGEAFLAKSVFDEDMTPYICVSPIADEPLVKAVWRGYNSIPSWSWKDCGGKETTVDVFTAAPKVRLWLNERLIGEYETKDGCASFPVIYHPGILRAESLSADGAVLETSCLVSATGEPRIRIRKEAPAPFSREELVFVDIDLVGENDLVWSNVDATIRVRVDGGALLGFGSALPYTEASFLSGSYPTYQGRSLAVIKPHARKIKITADADGMTPQTVTIRLK